ncbi:hypothetical protein N9235_02515 [Gammaproteobacteria bacterium]|nr:hypothetical protein [Gammaproteobacteria bacterium]
MSISVLRTFQQENFYRDPFPHLIIRDALPNAVCDQLIEEYPSLDTLEVDATQNNTRWSFPASRVKNNEGISEIWKELIEYHSSPAFFSELVEIFGESLIDLYPGRFESQQQLKQLALGVRGVDSFSDKDALLDAQISGNTPATSTRSVRSTHVDGGQALFAGLFYLRRDDDNSVGGDLEIRRFRPEVSDVRKPGCFRNATYVDDRWTEVVKTVKYDRNVLVILVNGIDSLHGVTPRQPTPHTRLFMNLVTDLDPPLFQIPSWRKSLKRFRRRILQGAKDE